MITRMSLSGVCFLALVGTAGVSLAQPEAASPAQPAQPAADPKSTRERAHEMASRAIAFLRTKQDQPTGGWSVNPKGPTFPAITALVLQGMLMHEGLAPTDPALLAGQKFLLDKQQPDGGIYDRILQNYNTAISLAALAQVKNPDAPTKAAIERAKQFLLGLQYSEDAAPLPGLGDSPKPVTKPDPFYGGFGYGNHQRPDLSNTSFAIEALRASGLAESDPALQRAIVFLQRCQMLETTPDGKPVNDSAYAKGSNQGGFIYATGPSGEQPGIGQSNAGELMESLDGPPGASVRFSLGKDKDGKPAKLPRDLVFKRIRDAIDATDDLGRGFVPTSLVVLMGPTSDGKQAHEFDVRANAAPARLAEVVKAAMADQIEGEVEVTPIEHSGGLVRHRAYGSMTYAGLKSYLYAGLTRDDPRVRAAVDWIGRNYRLSENPGVGDDGVYYSYVVFAKAMHARGLPTISVTTPAGVESRDWATDLVNQLATLQEPDGSFRPLGGRWLEGDAVLITAYALVSLEHAAQ